MDNKSREAIEQKLVKMHEMFARRIFEDGLSIDFQKDWHLSMKTQLRYKDYPYYLGWKKTSQWT